VDPQALELATQTLTAAIDSLMAKGAPFQPLVFVQKDGQRIPRRVTAAKGEEPAAAAKRIAASEEGADVTAYAASGTILYQGAPSTGIVVEAWNFVTGSGARVGLRYELKGSIRKKPSLIGSPLHRGPEGWYDPEDAEPSPTAAGHPEPVDELRYTAEPIQRSETPLGNRAMFAGIMELATLGGSFPAFAIVQKDGAWEQVTMGDASLAEAAASVRAYARTRTDADFIAIVVDGSVSVDGASGQAVVVKVWEYATGVSFSVAQRYVRAGEPPMPRVSGRPLLRTRAGWVDVPSSMVMSGQVLFGYSDPV
jgi:hypothetical protein